MIEKLKELAEKFGERTAYICEDESRTFAELFAGAQKIAKEISGADKSPVAVFGGKSCAVMETILACILEKRAYVPISPSIPEGRRREIIKSSGAGVLINCTEGEPKTEIIKNSAQTIEDNETAYIIFTSGSTGKPKGVPISYENLDNFISWITAQKSLSEYEHAKVLNHAEFNFDLSTAAVFYALFMGSALVQLPKTDDFVSIFETIKKNRPEIFVATPSFMRLCMLEKDFSENSYPYIKYIYFCGETLQKSLVKAIFERFPHIRIINAYGPTEATSAVCAAEITKEMLKHEDNLPVGIIENAAAEIEIEKGEIVLKGKSVFDGYLGGSEGGFYRIGEKRCYRTGDLGFIENGKLYFSGRKDGQIKYKGYRIELSEIEAVISSVEGVESCAVIAKRNTEGEVRLIKAFAAGTASEMSIRKELAEKLPEYMIPKTIKIMDSLPLNQNGKIDRKELEHR